MSRLALALVWASLLVSAQALVSALASALASARASALGLAAVQALASDAAQETTLALVLPLPGTESL